MISTAPAAGADYVANGSSSSVNGSNNGDPNPSNISGAGSTLTIEQGATITLNSDATNGVSFDAAPIASIVNLGTIVGGSDYATSASFWGMIVYGGSTGASVINRGVIDITDDNKAIGIIGNWDFGRSDDLFLSNEGTIRLDSPNSRGISLLTSDGGTLSNSGAIDITGATSRGLSAYEMTNTNEYNSGSITVTGDGFLGISALAGSTGSISNSGTIVGSGAGGSGLIVWQDSANMEILNSGTISLAGSDSDGFRIKDSSNTTATNSGLIETSGANGHGISVLDGTGAMITNSGTILVTGAGADGVRFEGASGGDGVRSLINSGTIFAATTAGEAIDFATLGTNDSLTLLAGTRLQGRIEMNGGTDKVVLNQTGDTLGWRFTLDDVDPDQITVLGGPYVIQPGDQAGSVTVTVGDLSRQAAGPAQLAQLSDTIGSGVFSDLLVRGAAGNADRDAYAWGRAFGDALSGDGAWSKVEGTIFGADTVIGDGTSRAGALAGVAQSAFGLADGTATTNSGFAGAYGHAAIGNNGFADILTLGGYSSGDGQSRLRANNLVTGGIETVTGSNSSGAFGAVQGRIGAYVPMQLAVISPSLTLGYAHQWRNGYTESAVAGTSMGAYGVDVLSARLELAALTGEKSAVRGVVRGGIDGELDVGSSLNVGFDGSPGNIVMPDQRRFDSFLGAGVQAALGANLQLNANAEARAGIAGDTGLGGRADIGLAGHF